MTALYQGPNNRAWRVMICQEEAGIIVADGSHGIIVRGKGGQVNIKNQGQNVLKTPGGTHHQPPG